MGKIETFHLKNAPITEAVLDFRFKTETPPTADTFEKFSQLISTEYSQRKEKRAFKTGIQFGQQELPKFLQGEDRVIGYIFSTGDGKQIVQVQNDGFTFNRLKPYDKWETFIAEAKRWWEEYRKLVGGLKISRIGLRYINRIELPLPFQNFKEYILTIPEVAPDLPQGIAELFMRLVIPHPELEVLGIITQAMEPIGGEKLPLVFDIDTFKNLNLEPTDAAVWTTVGDLRTFKNEIFFGSLTEQAKRLFQ